MSGWPGRLRLHLLRSAIPNGVEAWSAYETACLDFIDSDDPDHARLSAEVKTILDEANTTNYELRLHRKIQECIKSNTGAKKKAVADLLLEISQKTPAPDVHLTIVSQAREVVK